MTKTKGLYGYKTVQRILGIMGDTMELTPEVVTECMPYTRMTKPQTMQYLIRIKSFGLIRSNSTRSLTDGLFAKAEPPHPPTEDIASDRQVRKLINAITPLLEQLQFTSPVNTGEGPFNKSFEVKADGQVTVPAVNRLLGGLFYNCSRLLKRIARNPADVPHKPHRIFVCGYPVGSYSGMIVHRDGHLINGAVTLVLYDDEPGGSFFTANGNLASDPDVHDVPLLKGQAVAITPYMWHGVHECERLSPRISINMFY